MSERVVTCLLAVFRDRTLPKRFPHFLAVAEFIRRRTRGCHRDRTSDASRAESCLKVAAMVPAMERHGRSRPLGLIGFPRLTWLFGPRRVAPIWLFRVAASYEHNARSTRYRPRCFHSWCSSLGPVFGARTASEASAANRQWVGEPFVRTFRGSRLCRGAILRIRAQHGCAWFFLPVMLARHRSGGWKRSRSRLLRRRRVRRTRGTGSWTRARRGERRRRAHWRTDEALWAGEAGGLRRGKTSSDLLTPRTRVQEFAQTQPKPQKEKPHAQARAAHSAQLCPPMSCWVRLRRVGDHGSPGKSKV
jgi:hypothetical protein